MIDLDDEGALRAGDPGRMLDAIARLPEQCRVGYELGRTLAPAEPSEPVSAIVVCAMGSSAVCGDLVRAAYTSRLPIPVVVVRGPVLPEFVGPGCVVVASSYSGDTAEALAAFEDGVKRGARVVAVTSGGELSRRCEELGLACVRVPGGMMPRASLGFVAFGLLGALETMGVVPPVGEALEETQAELATIDELCAPAVPTSVNPAKRIAAAIGDRVPVSWGAEGFASVAADRWRTQFNENAKVPAFSSALPELDHNEVVGWSEGKGGRFFVVALRHEREHPEVAARFGPSIAIARGSGAEVEEVWARGASDVASFFSLVMTGDYVSTYLGLSRGVDPTPIEAIARLKRTLAEA